MIRSLLILLLIVFSTPAFAQERVTVVLKNGKVLEGKLIEALYEDFITIEYSALERDNVHLSHISGIYFGDYKPDQNQNQQEIDRAFFKREKGFFHVSEFQLMMGQDASGTSFSNQTLFQTINGFAFYPWLMLGGGVGIDKYGEFLISPFFVSVRGTVMQKKNSPYYYLNAGWAHFWEPEDNFVTYEKVKGGYHLQTGVGYQFNMSNSAILISLGYRLQDTQLRYSLERWDWNGMQNRDWVDEERLLRRLVLSLGFTF